MLLARISFVPHIDHEEAELVAAAESFLSALVKNGQLCGECVTGWSEGVLEAYVTASHRDALQSRYHSQWGQRELASVVRQFGAEPEWKILDDNAANRVSTVKSAASLYLFTHGLTAASPVMHGNRGTSLALPLLPITDQLREEIYFWQQSYLYHDRIWLDGGTLELAAYRELADPQSELNLAGKDICQQLQQMIEKPVYLCLMRYWGDAETEDNRPCPVCGSDWRDETHPLHTREPFHHFHFRCEGCRIVSHRAVAFDDDQHAQIGNFPSDS